MRNLSRWLFILLTFASVHLAEAQQPEKLPKIGFLQRRVPPNPTNPDPLADAFRQGLREIGYIEGKNIVLEHRYAGGKSDRLAPLVAELVQVRRTCSSSQAAKESESPKRLILARADKVIR